MMNHYLTHRQIKSRLVLEDPPSLQSIISETQSFDSTESIDELPPKSLKSDNIPIASGKLQRTPSEMELDMEEAMADYRDYAMYQRLVDGIQKTQSQTRDCRWRHANNMSLRRIHKARHGDETHGISKRLPAKLQIFDESSISGILPDVTKPDDEFMPFALEM